MHSITRRLLRALGHVPVAGARGVVWRLRGLLDETAPAEFGVVFGGLRYRDRLDDWIDWNVFFFGSYSPQELDFLAAAARLTTEAPAAVTYYDVGANVGHHALFMSQPATQVVAFEPARWARERFYANVRLNELGNVPLFPIGSGKPTERANSDPVLKVTLVRAR